MRDFADITVILDRSGSMSKIRDDTIGGFNAFLEDQKKVPGDGCWTLVQFDDVYETVYSQQPEGKVPILNRETFVPRGSTALIDAVVRTIDDTGKRFESMPEADRPSKVLMIIITDGQENASTKHTRDELFQKITHQRDQYGWQFIYLGANQDAFAEASKYGIDKSAAMNYMPTSAGVATAFAAAGRATRGFRATGKAKIN